MSLYRTVYYRIYTENGAILSKQAIGSQCPSLGRINVEAIVPPSTIAHIKRCIAKAEQLGDVPSNELFVDMASKLPMPEDEYMSMSASDHPGSTPEDPMAYVHFSKKYANWTVRLKASNANSQCKFIQRESAYCELLSSGSAS